MKNFLTAFLGSFFAILLLALIGVMALVGVASMAESSQRLTFPMSMSWLLTLKVSGKTSQLTP